MSGGATQPNAYAQYANRESGRHRCLQTTQQNSNGPRGGAVASPLSLDEGIGAQVARSRSNSRPLSSRWLERIPVVRLSGDVSVL